MSIKIDVSAGEQQTEEVWFGEDGPYEFVIPKISRITSAARRAQMTPDEGERGMLLLDAQMMWLAQGFGEEVWAEFEDRMDDPDDWLDTKHMGLAFESLMEKVTGRPTTSLNGSSRQRPARRRSGAPSPKASESETSIP